MKTYKQCPCCQNYWLTREELLQDASVELIGYQANFIYLELGFFLFNHLDCESTIAIPANRFRDLYDGPVFAQRLYGTEFCQGLCEDIEYLDPCENQCECAYVREIMQVIRSWPKAMPQLSRSAQG